MSNKLTWYGHTILEISERQKKEANRYWAKFGNIFECRNPSCNKEADFKLYGGSFLAHSMYKYQHQTNGSDYIFLCFCSKGCLKNMIMIIAMAGFYPVKRARKIVETDRCKVVKEQ